MANRLKMALVTTVYTLLDQGWSRRRIARELGIDRETVRRYARLREASNPAGAPPGSEASKTPISAPSTGSNPARAPTGSGGSDPPDAGASPGFQASACEPFREIIVSPKLELGLTATRIHQDLVTEHGFEARYHSVRRFVARLQRTSPQPFRRIETAPGEQGQVDFGTGAPVITAENNRRRTHVFRIVLSYSRKAYSEVVYRQTTEDFIRCIENAFHHFGGVPRTLVIDNLKAAVTRADWFDPELNPKIQSFCAHYGTTILPTKPRMPRHKGKVEKGIDYVQNNALKGRTFTSLAAENHHLREWEVNVADKRVHGTTQQQVQAAFAQEKPLLQPLPAGRFPSFQEAKRKVNRDGHVEVDKAYYSAPPEYLGRAVWARWDGRTVRLFNGRFEQIAIHAQRDPGEFSTADGHIPQQKRSGVEQGATQLLRKTEVIGPHSGAWAAHMVQQRGVEGVRVLMGLLSLAKRHPADRIEQACELASTHGAYRLRTIRELLKRQGARQEQFAFIDEHPIIRSLSDYGELVHTAFTQEIWR